MDRHRGVYHRLLNKRQGIGEVPGGLFPGLASSTASSDTTTSAALQSTSANEIIDGISSIFGDIRSFVLPSSTSLTTTSAPSAKPTSSTPSTTSSPSSTTSEPSPTLTPAPTSPSGDDVVYTSSDGTRIVYITSTLPAASAATPTPTSFLRNSSLEGGVFALVGIVVLILVFVFVTWTMRRRQRRRLERDLAIAVTFDPGATEQYDRREDSIEKHRFSGSSAGHEWGYGAYTGCTPYVPPQPEYQGAVEYPAPVYYASSPNPAPYSSPSSPGMQPPTGQGGANLTRKFSDRKPVPPLLPHPSYDPANAHVSIPPQFYQQ